MIQASTQQSTAFVARHIDSLHSWESRFTGKCSSLKRVHRCAMIRQSSRSCPNLVPLVVVYFCTRMNSSIFCEYVFKCPRNISIEYAFVRFKRTAKCYYEVYFEKRC
ncbi:uncharacterized protein PHALS_06994 [Plasmopara halstedii]|uniref:Uncharacterized protein n=1 Tax=Plasmopara halstedii TaxID=4781 RepID=A0A0P1B691_PLAHL|nr:uncharacterized protein PHALS_06994 [Plasmopara halstedii]CEG49222.1 hypothetical protein PHALS_06994 [Plasmopara halstedii]|eukprot:XP_024585591.1 hypothetical protein PHALS_06994 [Plasmopara halstedii]